MSRYMMSAASQPTAPLLMPVQNSVLQRACACGQHTATGEECAECRKQRGLRLQRAARGAGVGSVSNQAALGLSIFGHDFGGVPVSRPTDWHEQEAERATRQVMRNLSIGTRQSVPMIRRRSSAATLDRAIEETSPPTAEPAALPTAEPPTSEPAPAAGLLVEDDAEAVGPGQLRKSEFLNRLRAEVCSAANAVLAGVGRSTEGCPYLDYWFTYYGARSSQQTENAIHRYAPETSGAATASDYIPLIVTRVRQGVVTWARTGQITGVPEETAKASREADGEGAPPIQLKSRDSALRNPECPQAIQAQLGSGQPLASSVRSRMESAFGYDFSGVRVHHNTNAAALASMLNARAFTMGRSVAFGAGEYQPGTLLGDALIAHELAHVVQQGGSQESVAPLETGGVAYNALEADADHSAVDAIAMIWGKGVKAFKHMAKGALPHLRSGLRLQRCPGDQCPSGYYWQVINRAQLAGVCDCTWACRRSPTSGPTISDPNAPRPLLPGTRHTAGVGGQRASNLSQGMCYCLPLKDADGNILGTDLAAPPDQDYTGAAAAGAGMTQGPYRPPQTTSPRPQAAEVRPAIPPPTPPRAAPGGGGGVVPPSSPPASRGGGATPPVTVPPTSPSPGATRPRGPAQPTVIRPGTTPRGTAPQSAPSRTLSSATTTQVQELRQQGYVQQGVSGDGRSLYFRHVDTGDIVQITLRRAGPTWINPLWGRNRLEREMRARSFRFAQETRGEGGRIYRNDETREEIRIMPRPDRQFSDEPIEKHLNDNYYRYRTGPDQQWSDPSTIPNRE